MLEFSGCTIALWLPPTSIDLLSHLRENHLKSKLVTSFWTFPHISSHTVFFPRKRRLAMFFTNCATLCDSVRPVALASCARLGAAAMRPLSCWAVAWQCGSAMLVEEIHHFKGKKRPWGRGFTHEVKWSFKWSVKWSVNILQYINMQYYACVHDSYMLL